MTAVPAALEPTSARRSYPVGWWGMVGLIATEATIFALLLSADFFLLAQAKEWPPAGIENPRLGLAIPFSLVLWASSIPILIAEAAIEKGKVRTFRNALAVSFVMGAAFVAYSVYDFRELHFGWRDNAYGSTHYTIIGLHLAHVCVGLIMSAVVQAKAWTGRYDDGPHVSATVFALYWHFVDAVWLVVFPSLFLLPRWVT